MKPLPSESNVLNSSTEPRCWLAHCPLTVSSNGLAQLGGWRGGVSRSDTSLNGRDGRGWKVEVGEVSRRDESRGRKGESREYREEGTIQD